MKVEVDEQTLAQVVLIHLLAGGLTAETSP